MIFNVPKTLTTIGINEPITINNDCFEKKPAFFIEYLNNIIILIINKV